MKTYIFTKTLKLREVKHFTYLIAEKTRFELGFLP